MNENLFRPRALLDTDGVLGNFHEPCLDLINEIGGTKFTLDDLKEWDLFNALGVDKDVKAEVYRRMKEPGWCTNLPVYPGAVEGVAKLRAVADVYIVTSPMNGPTWTSERDEWLYRHFGFKTKQIIHTSAKYVCAGDALIDDKIENLVKWKSGHPKGLAIRWLVPQYKSQVYSDGPTTADWDEICAMMFNSFDHRNRTWQSPTI